MDSASGQIGAGENQPSFLLDTRVLSPLPQIFLLPSSLPDESSIPMWSCATTAWAPRIQGICQIAFGYLFFEVWGLHGRVQF